MDSFTYLPLIQHVGIVSSCDSGPCGGQPYSLPRALPITELQELRLSLPLPIKITGISKENWWHNALYMLRKNELGFREGPAAAEDYGYYPEFKRVILRSSF